MRTHETDHKRAVADRDSGPLRAGAIVRAGQGAIGCDQAERWAIHSQEVLRQTTAILEPVLGESVALRGAVLANDARFATPVSVWMDVDRRIDQLAELVADNPAQVERVVQVRQAVQAYRQWSDRIQDMLHSGRRRDVLERFRDLAPADVLDRFRQQLGGVPDGGAASRHTAFECRRRRPRAAADPGGRGRVRLPAVCRAGCLVVHARRARAARGPRPTTPGASRATSRWRRSASAATKSRASI